MEKETTKVYRYNDQAFGAFQKIRDAQRLIHEAMSDLINTEREALNSFDVEVVTRLGEIYIKISEALKCGECAKTD